jgi:FixJ family two-component response regulator
MAAAIKQVSPKMPIILLTGFGQFLEKGSTPNVDVVASKPIGVVALRDAISTALKVA